LTTDYPRVAVVGAGAFGRNHLRVIHQTEHATLAGVYDTDSVRAQEAAATYGCPIFSSLDELARNADGAVVATPTITHSEIGCRLMESGLHVLVEKPIAPSLPAAQALLDTASRTGRILAVGHLERFNPAVIALGDVITKPLFFEIHRLSEFTPRSLDVDVVLDLMIHDIDIVLALTGEKPEEIRAAGISILTPKVDIANVRLQFPGGCVANLTASRVSTERVRKLRLFQPHEYISLDYSRKDGARFKVKPPMAIEYAQLPVTKDEPLRLELEDFFRSMISREQPRVTGGQALSALEVACAILDKIEAHSQRVASALAEGGV
jgi:predicted dehydrogenase